MHTYEIWLRLFRTTKGGGVVLELQKMAITNCSSHDQANKN